jgi:hypothetical protein
MLDYQLLAPQEELQRVYPYRRVWRALLAELLLYGLVCTLLLGLSFTGVLSDAPNRNLQIGLAMLPVGLFLWFSVRPERQVFQPRQHLIPLLVLSAILTNGITVPLLNEFFTPELWLPGQDFFGRIFGYMATAGILTAALQYGIVRYTVWPSAFRIRLDGIAYCMATALGYATVLNLQAVLQDDLLLSAAIIRLLVTLYLHVSIGTIIGYFLGEFAIGRPSIVWMPLGLGIASFVYGVFMAFRAIAVRSGLSTASTGNRAIGPYFLAIGMSLLILWVVAFLIESADERMALREGVERIR